MQLLSASKNWCYRIEETCKWHVMVSLLLREHGKRRVGPSLQENEARGRLGEAAMKESFPEIDLCSVQSCREGYHGGIGRDQLGLTVWRALV